MAPWRLSAGDDGLKAVKNLTIDGGTVNVSKSNEALEALNVTINKRHGDYAFY